MPERDHYIPGVPCWVDSSQPDPAAGAEFYAGLFGWEFEDVMPPGSPQQYLIGRVNGGDVAAIGSIPEGQPQLAMWNTYVAVADADATAATVRGAGGTVLMEPFDVMEAGRMAVFADPEGAVFEVWQANQMIGARVVNEHGTVNFNGLNTRAVDAAKAFYGAVFGWTTIDLGGPEMWTLPGYGDDLERDNPDLRKMIAETGGPPGFEDVVASITPIADDAPDTPPHWSVTFAVDDVAAIAARAPELGGALVVPPMDVPWSRMAVVRDPQGATFIASQFVPENKDIGG
jgi:predicted enzyme related to lactoylglutathione lyase